MFQSPTSLIPSFQISKVEFPVSEHIVYHNIQYMYLIFSAYL